MTTIRTILALAVTTLALLALGASSAAAWDPQPILPDVGDTFDCAWEFLSGPRQGQSGTSKLTYTGITCSTLADGNTLCRPVYSRDVYPNGGVLEAKVTITKPFSCDGPYGYPQCTTWEYTVNQPFQMQCKTFRVEETFTGYPYRLVTTLDFAQCENGIVQTCEHSEPLY